MMEINSWLLKSSRQKSQNLDAKGFTLLETVIALLVLLTCVSLIGFSVNQLRAIRNQTFQDRQLEWHLFLNQFNYEIKGLVLKDVSTSKVRFEEQDAAGKTQRVHIYQRDANKTVFIKTTDSGGYQPLMMKVSKLTFSKKDTFLILRVTFTNNENYSAQVNLSQLNEGADK